MFSNRTFRVGVSVCVVYVLLVTLGKPFYGENKETKGLGSPEPYKDEKIAKLFLYRTETEETVSHSTVTTDQTKSTSDEFIYCDVKKWFEKYPQIKVDYWDGNFHGQHSFLNGLAKWNTRANYRTLIEPKISFSKDKVRLLVAIKSIVKDVQLRLLLRQLWLNKDDWNYTLSYKGLEKQVEIASFFIIGKEKDVTSEKQKQNYNSVKNESDQFGDILYGDFEDSFQNLAVKEHLFLSFVASLGEDVFDFIFKGDSDILVNPSMLLDEIFTHLIPASQKSEIGAILGCRAIGSRPFVDHMSKYFVPNEIWPSDKPYYPYVSGGGFVLTADLARRMAQVMSTLVTDRVPIFPIDDAYVGSLVHEVEQAAGFNKVPCWTKTWAKTCNEDVTVLLSENFCWGLYHQDGTYESNIPYYGTFPVMHKFDTNTIRNAYELQKNLTYRDYAGNFNGTIYKTFMNRENKTITLDSKDLSEAEILDANIRAHKYNDFIRTRSISAGAMWENLRKHP